MAGAFIVGIAIASFIEVKIFFMLLFLAAAIILISVWRSVKILKLAGLLILFVILGIWRMEIATGDKVNHIKDFNDEGNITFQGIIASEPDIRKDKIKYTVQVESLNNTNEQKNITGKVLISVPRYPEYNYGEKLLIEGELLTPKVYDSFSYKDYLSKFDIYSVSYSPRIEVVSRNDGNFIYKSLLNLKKDFKESLNRSLPEPQSSLLNGIILGEKRGLPEDLREKFNLTGVSHIIVISGFHVAIVAGLLMNFCLVINLSRKKSFWVSILGILFFIAITGFQTSAIRAAIMGGLVLLAMHSGRLKNPRNAIALAAIIMLFINPKLLRYDVGFQLSFLATISIIYLSGNIIKYLKFLPKYFKIRESAAMTLAAQFLTLPIIIYNFERFSLIAPLANILIVPTVPISMLLGSLAGAMGFISEYLNQFISYFVWLLLSYKILIVRYLSSLRYSYFEIYDLWYGWIIIYYMSVFYIFYRARKKQIIKNKIE